MKKGILGFIISAFIFGTIGVYAGSYIADPVGFKIFVNGNEFISDPPALVVEGRTYLPLRAMGQALGVPVVWNADLGQAEVGKTPSPTVFDAQNIISKLETKTFTRQTNAYSYVHFIIKNNSDKCIRLNIQLKLKDASGNLVGAKKDTLYAFAPNQEFCLSFQDQEAFEDFEYTYNVAEANAVIPQNDNLSTKVFKTDNKAIVEVKNHSSAAIDGVRASLLFLKDGDIVGSSDVFPGSRFSLKENEDMSMEINCFQDFDEVKLYTQAYNYSR